MSEGVKKDRLYSDCVHCGEVLDLLSEMSEEWRDKKERKRNKGERERAI